MLEYRMGTSTWRWVRTTADWPNALSTQSSTSTCSHNKMMKKKRKHSKDKFHLLTEFKYKKRNRNYLWINLVGQYVVFNLRACCSPEWLALSGSKWLRSVLGRTLDNPKGGAQKESRREGGGKREHSVGIVEWCRQGKGKKEDGTEAVVNDYLRGRNN